MTSIRFDAQLLIYIYLYGITARDMSSGEVGTTLAHL
jgi:hypothetical protein